MRARSRRRVRVALIVVALLVVVANLVPAVRTSMASVAERASGGVLNLMGQSSQQVERAKSAQMRAEQRANSVRDADAVVRQADTLAGAYTSAMYSMQTARVLSATPVMAAGGERKVEINRGSADGVSRNRAVVGSGGLVGRVTQVEEHTATVTLLADPSSVVGVRVGEAKTLARVTGAAPSGATTRSASSLSLILVPGGTASKGDAVVTSGSPGGVPYPSGILVGRISKLDADHGQIERAATVQPAVDASRLDVVGVLEPRRQ